MPQITVLDKQTIDQIAAGEVVERPASVVKELVENAIDAGATAITVEIKQGGISFIRITDNGCGVEKKQIPTAFLRHATSKITKVSDLLSIQSLGFRGEALSSISAVAQVEFISKTKESLTGSRYVIEGGVEKSLEEIGAPEGTTILVRNLFYNVPARSKFLKTATTEGNYISSYLEQLALSHPSVSFKYVMNGQVRFQTTGRGELKEIIYQIYGRDIARELLPVSYHDGELSIQGFIGKPIISRGNRNFENYYVNGRYVKDKIIMKGIEEGYRTFMMQHQYPFTCLYYTLPGTQVDINVHPAKMEVSFSSQEDIYFHTKEAIIQALHSNELVFTGDDGEKKKTSAPVIPKKEALPEPFEQKRRAQVLPPVSPAEQKDTGVKADTGAKAVYERNAENSTKKPFSTDNGIMKTSADPGNRIMRDKAAVYGSVSSESHTSKSTERVSSNLFTEERDSQLLSEALREPQHIKADSRSSTEQKLTSESDSIAIKEASDFKTQNQPEAIKAGTTSEKISADTNTPVSAETQELTPQPQKTVEPVLSNKPEELQHAAENQPAPQQMTLFDKENQFPLANEKNYRIIGQLFETYWLFEMEDTLYIMDQHAAHEKVMFERLMKEHKERAVLSQMISPPIILHPSMQEMDLLKEQAEVFLEYGFELEPFGSDAMAIRSVPHNLYGIPVKQLFDELLAECEQGLGKSDSREVIGHRIATMACKAAVKGSSRMSVPEVQSLIRELLTLDNPYQCPHGRPTIVRMTKTEIEKKFRRIV